MIKKKERERESIFLKLKYTEKEEVLLTALSLIKIIFYHSGSINYNVHSN